MINQFIKLSSLLSVLFIIYGILCNYIYYNEFGISITEYIDLGEAALLFIPFLKGILLLFVIFLMVYFFIKESLFNKESKFYNHPNNIQGRQNLTKQSIVLFILLPVFFAAFFIFSLNYMFLTFPLIILMLYGPFFILWLFKKIEDRNILRVNKYVGDLIIIFLLFSTLVVFTSYQKIFRTIHKKNIKEFTINFKSDQTLIGDSNVYYLGRTKKYLFIYYSEAEKTKVFDVDKIENVEFFKK